MPTPTLIKKTKKSIINSDSSEHYGASVEHLLTFGRGKNYLAWIYFHIYNITFMDDVLDELFGKEHNPNINLFIIGKPGTKPSLFKQWSNLHPEYNDEYDPNPKLFGGLTGKQIEDGGRHAHKKLAGTIMSDRHDKNRGRKSDLQRKNHGK